MHVVTVGMAGTIAWSLRLDDPVMFPVGDGRCSILTPFAASSDGTPIIPVRSQLAHRDGRQWMTTTYFAFAFESEADARSLYQDHPAILRRLRFFAKQPALPRHAVVYQPQTVAAVVSAGTRSPAFELGGGAQIRSDLLRAISADALRRLSSDDVVPVFGDVLLDAIEAMLESDFRKSILYAAIAVEAAASTALEAEYGRLIAAPAGAEHRVLAARGNRAAHDPIYLRLAQRPNSRTRLHELPLYLLGRSLLVQNEALFTRAMRLSDTRNGLAHTGDVSPRADAYALDRSGALECLETARQVFEWFGLESDYPTSITHAEFE